VLAFIVSRLLQSLAVMLAVSFLMLLVINAIQAWSRRFV
jgi:ABC-type sulfate transport system permease component